MAPGSLDLGLTLCYLELFLLFSAVFHKNKRLHLTAPAMLFYLHGQVASMAPPPMLPGESIKRIQVPWDLKTPDVHSGWTRAHHMPICPWIREMGWFHWPGSCALLPELRWSHTLPMSQSHGEGGPAVPGGMSWPVFVYDSTFISVS